MTQQGEVVEDVVQVTNGSATSRYVLVCEHASHHIPSAYGTLGLAPKERYSHAAWDPGALGMAKHLAIALNAKLVAGAVSRLVYDINRPAGASDAVPSQSEQIAVPGNVGLSASDIAERERTFYRPFKAALTRALDATAQPVLITLHSFTPVYHAQHREVEIGILHHDDRRLADALLRLSTQHSKHLVRRNEPYGPADGVTHTLAVHGEPRGCPNVMIEVRNDLLATPAQQHRMGDILTGWITAAEATL
ncbi:MAG: N-formylglutamate amidohydrolase [Pseudomonadota bacterium]